MGTHKNCFGEAVLTCTHNQCFSFNTKKIKIFLMQFSNFTAEKNLCRFYITWALCSDMIKVFEVIHAVAHLDGPLIIILR